ncbi:hypothetical protein DFH09DRAFT_1083475 [Mycena vulgaris]|nr:hypothetical protein DFH09DRAFT_1083475 [Mycena vulgaris]
MDTFINPEYIAADETPREPISSPPATTSATSPLPAPPPTTPVIRHNPTGSTSLVTIPEFNSPVRTPSPSLPATLDPRKRTPTPTPDDGLPSVPRAQKRKALDGAVASSSKRPLTVPAPPLYFSPYNPVGVPASFRAACPADNFGLGLSITSPSPDPPAPSAQKRGRRRKRKQADFSADDDEGDDDGPAREQHRGDPGAGRQEATALRTSQRQRNARQEQAPAHGRVARSTRRSLATRSTANHAWESGAPVPDPAREGQLAAEPRRSWRNRGREGEKRLPTSAELSTKQEISPIKIEELADRAHSPLPSRRADSASASQHIEQKGQLERANRMYMARMPYGFQREVGDGTPFGGQALGLEAVPVSCLSQSV